MPDAGTTFFVRDQDCGRSWCSYRFDAHGHPGRAVGTEADQVAQLTAQLADAEEQLQVSCGLAFDVGAGQAGRRRWRRRMEVANVVLRKSIRGLQGALAAAVAEVAKRKDELNHLGAKLFAERRAYRAGVGAALEEMRAVVRRNEELTVALRLMTKRAAVADALLGRDASGRSLAATLDYAAGLLGASDPGDGLFSTFLREKARAVRRLAAFPGGPAPEDESAVPDAPSCPDGCTPHGGEVFQLANHTAELTPEASRKAGAV